MRRLCFVVLCGSLMWPAWAAGQTVLNPTRVQFESPDHNATLASGEPAISRYDLKIYLEGTAAPLSTTDLGKPASTGTQVTATPNVLVGLPVGQLFTARVAAVGPAGVAESEASNPFTRAVPPRAPLKPAVLP